MLLSVTYKTLTVINTIQCLIIQYWKSRPLKARTKVYHATSWTHMEYPNLVNSLHICTSAAHYDQSWAVSTRQLHSRPLKETCIKHVKINLLSSCTFYLQNPLPLLNINQLIYTNLQTVQIFVFLQNWAVNYSFTCIILVINFGTKV